jgi:serine/threonine-protein kinase RsbW
MIPDEQTVKLSFPAKAEYIGLCRLALSGFVRVRPISEETLADLKLALTEAASNSVRHAYGDDGGRVDIVYRLRSDRLEIEVLDEGKGFELRDRPNGEDFDESGLGLAIIRALTDELEVLRRDGARGAMLRFTKRLD